MTSNFSTIQKTKLVFLCIIWIYPIVGLVYSSTLIIWALITNYGFFPQFPQVGPLVRIPSIISIKMVTVLGWMYQFYKSAGTSDNLGLDLDVANLIFLFPKNAQK